MAWITRVAGRADQVQLGGLVDRCRAQSNSLGDLLAGWLRCHSEAAAGWAGDLQSGVPERVAYRVSIWSIRADGVTPLMGSSMATYRIKTPLPGAAWTW